MRILGIDQGLRITGFSFDITCVCKVVSTETHHQCFDFLGTR